MTDRTMKTAGWLAMFSAFASLPAVYLSWKLEGRVDVTATLIQTILQLTGMLLFVVITLYLKKFLHARCGFHATDRNIDVMIRLNLIAGALTILALFNMSYKETIALAVIILMVAQGIVQAQFGYRLLKLPDSLWGVLKPFCYANMATGIMVASVVLLLGGVVTSVIADLMLGTIFFHAARVAGPQPPLEAAGE